MSFLLDTNLLSELIRPLPNQGVLQWMQQHPEQSYYISVITLSELEFGITRLADGQRKTDMQCWLHTDLRQRFLGRMLPVSDDVALRCGAFRANRQMLGRPLALADGLIAATAAESSLTLVTRNIKDFEALAISLLNPFD